MVKKKATPESAHCYKWLSELRSTPSILQKHNEIVGLKKRSVSQLDKLLFLDVFHENYCDNNCIVIIAH